MGMRMTQERKEAYVEVLEIISHMDKKYQDKIPLKLKQFFLQNASKEYEFKIDLSIPLNEYKLHDNTINILAMLNLNYWCEDEKHKQELIKQYEENEKKYQEALKEKYNYDNLFKKSKIGQEIQEKVFANEFEIIEYKETLIKKIINKIKNIVKNLYPKI